MTQPDSRVILCHARSSKRWPIVRTWGPVSFAFSSLFPMSDENSPVGTDTQVNALKLGNRKKPCVHRSSLVSHGDPQ